MRYIRVFLENGHDWLISDSEVIVPKRSLHEMTPQEIGRGVASLAPLVDRFSRFVLSRDQRNLFESSDDFRAEERASIQSFAMKQAGKAFDSNSEIWQIDYQTYTAADFKRMLEQDVAWCIFAPPAREVLETFIQHTESWQAVARALGLSVPAVQDRIRTALREYKTWEAKVGRGGL